MGVYSLNFCTFIIRKKVKDVINVYMSHLLLGVMESVGSLFFQITKWALLSKSRQEACKSKTVLGACVPVRTCDIFSLFCQVLLEFGFCLFV